MTNMKNTLVKARLDMNDHLEKLIYWSKNGADENKLIYELSMMYPVFEGAIKKRIKALLLGGVIEKRPDSSSTLLFWARQDKPYSLLTPEERVRKYSSLGKQYV